MPVRPQRETRGSAPYCVCVPARNEEAHLPPLLKALALHDRDEEALVVVALNNTTDRSMEVLHAAQATYAGRLRIIADVKVFAPEDAHAGSARRRAFEVAIDAVGGSPNAILITTDADARPPPHWITANLSAMARGVDLVGGRLLLDEDEPLAASVLSLRALWDTYWSLVRHIEDTIDPIPWDPPPRHGDHTGGSLAITLAAYTAAGGVPALASGEDRALVTAALATGARLSHPARVWTRVSARLDGRADRGMAAAMAELFDAARAGREVMAPSLRHWQDRAHWRRQRRAHPDGPRRLALDEATLPPMPHDARLKDIVAASVRQGAFV